MPPAPPALRKLTLAVAVLHDVDLMPDAAGLVLTRSLNLQVGWDVIAGVVEAADRGPEPGERARIDALAAWLKAREALAAGATLGVLGVPAEHVNHPGQDWVRDMVPGGALCLGFGYHRAPSDWMLPVPAGVLPHTGRTSEAIAAQWKAARLALEAAGEVAALRDRRHVSAALVPVGITDVVTLLAAASLRRELVEREGDGMAALIVPLRTRGWRANSIADPAYGPALAAAMEPPERGFVRPLLVTADEVSEVRAGGDPMRLLRRDAEES